MHLGAYVSQHSTGHAHPKSLIGNALLRDYRKLTGSFPAFRRNSR